MSYEYHQLLKYVYFEGYVNSYEEAEYLLEQLSDNEFYELCENVSSGRTKRASSKRAPVSQRVTASDIASANRMGSTSRMNPADPKDKGDARNPGYISGVRGVKARQSEEEEKIDSRRRAWQATRKGDLWKGEDFYRGKKMVPSRGIRRDDRVLRRHRGEEGGPSRPTSPQGLAKDKVNYLKRFDDPEKKARVKKIRAALANKEKWGTPEAAKEEYVINYLVMEGYTDNYDSAIEIYESMSDQWLHSILVDVVDEDIKKNEDNELDEKFVQISHDKAKRMKDRSSKLNRQVFNIRHSDPEKSKTLSGKKSLIDVIHRDMYSRRLRTIHPTGEQNPEYDDLVYKTQVASVKAKEKANKQKRK